MPTIDPLNGLHIVLGVTGSIAAYKAADLASKLSKTGALVDVILTQSAEKMISPLTFQSVTGRKAYTDNDLWGREGHVVHVSLGHAAHLLLIAPATANTIAKLANGLADNLLTDTALVSSCPIVIAPAMETHMYQHPATQKNISILIERGVKFIGPDEGHLASGATGFGRFVEPPDILSHLRYLVSRNGPLKGRKIVVTAGGTQEPIDPVRVLTNRSSGKQGYAIAQSALNLGADVTLISASTCLKPPIGADVISIRTAEEMLHVVLAHMSAIDVLIMSAAVADFRPSNPVAEKIKKDKSFDQIILEPTADILKAVGNEKKSSGYPHYIVGFAAESQDLIHNAKQKLSIKNLDMIVANNITSSKAGFEVDTNQVTFLLSDGSQRELPILSKNEVADLILEQIQKWLSV